MKTIVLTKQELDSLPKEVREMVMNVYNSRSVTMSELKKRISDLPYLNVSYRSDNNSIEGTDNSDNYLSFAIWWKTAGEQWGNKSGREYQFRIGRKYVRMDVVSFASNRMDYNVGSYYCSENKLAEILDLLEEAYNEGTADVDRDRLLSIACSRVKRLEPNCD